METNLIETTLPLVYCKKNEFYVLNGLNLERKNELWGIDLSPNCLLSLTKMLNSNDSPIKNKADVQKYVKSMIFKGKYGSLPSAELLGKIWNKEIYDKLCNLKGIKDDGGYFPAYRKES